MKFKNFKIKHFLSALLSIMEVNFRDKSFSITNYICIFSIYFQPLSYISKINYKNGADPKLSVLNQFFFLINYPNILSYVRLNGIFYIFFALVNIILYFLLIMFILNTILLRYKMNRILESKIFIYLNYVCQKITYVFNSFLLIPILEILSNSLDCDWYSYITQCNSVPMILSLLSILGFGLSIFYCFLFLWLNRSYLFLDSHVLNSKFTISIFLRYISKVSLVILWPLFKNNHIIVFVLIHSIGILGLIDFFLEFHISNKQYGKFYLSVLMSYQTIVSLYTIDKYTNLFEEVDLFFIIFICVILFIKTSLFIFEKYHINILINNFSRSNYLVYALENLYYNYLNKYNEIDSFNFYGMLRLHVINCEIKDCCLSRKKLDMIETMKYGEKENLINNFISEIFIRQLQKIISNEKKNFNYDTIIFKYCSFLSNYSLNPIKAFYEIQHIMTLKQQKSFYFNSISLILLKKVKSMIFDLEKQTNINDLANEKEIDLKTYFQILKEKKKIKENFISILKLKLTFFDKYKEGIFSYEQMIKNCNSLINPIKEFRNELDKKLIERKENSRLIFLFKFQILFQSFVLNNVNEGLRIEDELEKLKKKEMTLDTTILNFNSFFYNNLVTIQISYLVNNGLIIESSKNFQFANFFNYTSEELKSIKNIDTFMPEIISQNHKSFITYYVNKPRTKLTKDKKYISSFALTKEGFIFPIKLYVGHCFDQNYDFAFHAALIDLGLRNEKIILVDSIGQIVGLTKEFFKLFPNQNQRIFNNKFKYLNIYPLISNLETLISKNQLFEDNISLTVSNINSLLSIPSNFDEILDIILLKVREDEDESKNNKRSNSKRSETMKSKKSEASSKTLKSGNNNRDRTITSKFFSRFFKTVNCSNSEKKEIEEKMIQNQLSLKEIFSELAKNAQSFNKFLINYSIKNHSHNISDKAYLKLACITINSISIYNNTSKQTKEDIDDELKNFDPEITIQQSPILSNSKMLSQDIFSNIPESEISGLNLPPINKPIVELGNQKIESNEIVGTGTTIIQKETENHYENNKLFTTENDQEELFHSKEMKLEKLESSNLKKSNIKKTKTNSFSEAENKVSKNLSSGGKINLLNENASQNTSTNQSKKTFIIFNIIKMIQNTYPNQIKGVHISQYLQATVVVAFCLVVYIISDQYIGKYHEPLQLSTSNLAKIYNFYTAACLLTIRGEFTIKNYLGNQPAAAIYQGIYNDIFNISYYGIKNIVEEEERNSKDFDYLNYMKTYEFETTDPNAPILKKQTIFSFLKEINKIAFLLINIPVTQVNTKSLEYFQVNFMNIYDYYQVLSKKISNQFYESSFNMKYTIENVMISLMVLSFCIGLFQLYYLNKFTERLIKCLNIFIRVNQTEAYNEIVFTKDILDILNHPSEMYINLNCTEKVINKKALRITDQDVMNSNRSSKTTDKNNNKKKNAKNNFSFHNIRNFSKGYSLFFISFIFLLLFAFLFANYYYFTITYTQIVNLIDLSIIFGKLSTVPPTGIALNRICLREKIVSNSLYDYSRNFERETRLYNTLLESINELGSIITIIPKYSANSDSMKNEILRTIIYGSETSDLCQELLKVNILNQERSDLCQKTLNRAFSKNLLTAFGSLIVALREEFVINIPIDFSDQTKRAAQRELIYINLKSTAGLERILSEYFLLKTIFYFNAEMEKYYTNLMKTYMETLQVIVLGTTISLIVFFIILIFLTNTYLKSLYENITLILNIIPYEKIANDEQTNFLIKKYWRD